MGLAECVLCAQLNEEMMKVWEEKFEFAAIRAVNVLNMRFGSTGNSGILEDVLAFAHSQLFPQLRCVCDPQNEAITRAVRSQERRHNRACRLRIVTIVITWCW
jgi:hypothetical protein